MDQRFVVGLRPPRDRQRPKALFYPPAFWQEHEAFGEVGTLDDLNDAVRHPPHSLDERVLLAAVDHHGLNPWTSPDQAFDKWHTAILILDIRPRDFDREQPAIDVHRDMALAAHNLLSGIIAALAMWCIALDRLGPVVNSATCSD